MFELTKILYSNNENFWTIFLRYYRGCSSPLNIWLKSLFFVTNLKKEAKTSFLEPIKGQRLQICISAQEGSWEQTLYFKMIIIVALVGVRQVFRALPPLVFELLTKTSFSGTWEVGKVCISQLCNKNITMFYRKCHDNFTENIAIFKEKADLSL